MSAMIKRENSDKKWLAPLTARPQGYNNLTKKRGCVFASVQGFAH